jgi:hypothetical protein
MILSSHVSDEKIFLFFSLLGNSIPNLVRLSGLRRMMSLEIKWLFHALGTTRLLVEI